MAKYIWQPIVLLIFLFLMLTLFYLNAASNILWAVGAGSLASSGFVVFAKPSGITAKPYHVIVSYLIAILVGVFFRFVVERWLMHCINLFAFHSVCWGGFLAALAVIVSMLLMIKFKAEHPPAAGVALVLVLDVKDYETLFIILVSVLILAGLSRIFQKHLQDLF